jgi:hypothetical protein
MLKARYGENMIFGLSRQNVNRLLAGQPIRFNLKDLNLPPADVVIFFGETEEAMMKDLEAHGLAPVAAPPGGTG